MAGRQESLNLKQDYASVGDLADYASNVTFVVGAEATNVINVGVTISDGRNVAVDAIYTLTAFLSDSATGEGVNATAPDGGIAKGTNGNYIELVAGKNFLLQTNSSGLVDIDITESLADTWYLVIVLPDGTIAVSSAITFA